MYTCSRNIFDQMHIYIYIYIYIRASNSPALRGSLPPGYYFSRSPGKHVPAKHVKSPALLGKIITLQIFIGKEASGWGTQLSFGIRVRANKGLKNG